MSLRLSGSHIVEGGAKAYYPGRGAGRITLVFSGSRGPSGGAQLGPITAIETNDQSADETGPSLL